MSQASATSASSTSQNGGSIGARNDGETGLSTTVIIAIIAAALVAVWMIFKKK